MTPPGRARAPLALVERSGSLRIRVLLLLVTINALVAAVTFGFAARRSAQDVERTTRLYEQQALILRDNLVDTVAAEIVPGGGLNVAPILSWPYWSQFADAILLDSNLALAPDGRVVPLGRALNPLGRAHRPATFNEQAVYDEILRAVNSGTPIDDVEGGRVVPIELRGGGDAWGGCWYKTYPPPARTNLLLSYFLPAFLLSTLLLSAGTFLFLRRAVLDPLAQLAQATRRVEAGDLSVRLPEPRKADEIAALVHGFNAMIAEVEGFNARLAAEVQRATEQARRAEAVAMTQRRLAAMGELAAGIAHEINNPLGGLSNAVTTLGREDLDPGRRKRYLELLASGLERIGQTVGQLLRFTPRRTPPDTFALIGPVRDALDLVRHRAQRQGVTLTLHAGKPGDADASADEAALEPLLALPPVRGEAGELGQAVLNLLVNALDALEGTGGGHVDVWLAAEPGGLVLSVVDDGPGADAAVLERAPDLFFTTKEAGRGTGLGLAIVHKVVAAHGGRVELASRPGAGFTATLHLPLAPREGTPR
jgi:signal transduction histidine kinase